VSTRRLDVRVSQVVNRIVVKVNLEQLFYPLSGEPLLLTHENEPDRETVSLDVHSGVENSYPVGDVT
jgi:hypothetical protein